jgi:hypothetical protein
MTRTITETYGWEQYVDANIEDLSKCPDPEKVIIFALNESIDTDTDMIRDHIRHCLSCRDLAAKLQLSDQEASAMQREKPAVPFRLLRAIHKAKIDQLINQLNGIGAILSAAVIHRSVMRQNRLVFGKISTEDIPLIDVDRLSMEIKITPAAGKIFLPVGPDDGSMCVSIPELMKKNIFYTHVYAWDARGERYDLGVYRHEHLFREISVNSHVVLLVILGVDGNAVEHTAQRIPLWLEHDNSFIETGDDENTMLLVYQIMTNESESTLEG